MNKPVESLIKGISKGLVEPELTLKQFFTLIGAVGLCLSMTLAYSAFTYQQKFPSDMWLRFWLEDISPSKNKQRSDEMHKMLKQKHRQSGNYADETKG